MCENRVPELIVMLTKNDETVPDAKEIFEKCKNSKAKCWGFKEKSLAEKDMKDLFSYMKEYGKTTFLEVVEYTEKECVQGAELAVRCGVDVLMGTMYSDEVNEICRSNSIKYMPFVGDVTQRPSVLDGSIESIKNEAAFCKSKGVFGIDLLGYRYTGDAYKLNYEFTKSIDLPVCIAGSVDSYKRLDEIKTINPRYFTVGSAFFDNKFGTDFASQIDAVCDYMKNGGKENA